MKTYCSLLSGILLVLIAVLGFENCSKNDRKVQLDINKDALKQLSDYSFFVLEEGMLKPNEGVISYTMVNSMFNDYMYREKYFYLPENTAIEYDSQFVFPFPLGSCLINSVYYYEDERNKPNGKHYVETQLLVKNQKGWEAMEYIWNEEQSDAELSQIGDIKNLSWLDENGNETKVEYVLPSKNQCKNCHWYDDHIAPIGIKAGNLNLEVKASGRKKNQLKLWQEREILKNLSGTVMQFADWTNTSLPIFSRVKSYFDINCAHCHNPKGQANFCGLFLNRENENMETYGVFKSPTSAARGSCDLKNDIVPGKPGESIVICRMASTNLRIKMPPLGRATNDNKGIALIIEWIAQMEQPETK